jgi:hypothetical protein
VNASGSVPALDLDVSPPYLSGADDGHRPTSLPGEAGGPETPSRRCESARRAIEILRDRTRRDHRATESDWPALTERLGPRDAARWNANDLPDSAGRR